MKGQVDNVLTINGDMYYDYGKFYQSILGYDLILNGLELDYTYVNKMKQYFLEKCNLLGLNIEYLKYVTKGLIFGTFHSIEEKENIKKSIWDLLNSELLNSNI
jgi:hypothetical protein